MKINRLKKVLKEKKVSGRVIAKYIKKSEGTVSKWKNNHRQPSVNELVKIAEFLRVDVRCLLRESDWSNSKAPTHLEYKSAQEKVKN